ncbi:MAG TPA: right-handed parallel beta-helix repeat-containing protein, partial [Chthoniobacteraceae bacterium]|nr:right-handed parallel beta-helix repeat-containing protein [Chthoniobacteraceae bacterium]
PGEQVLFQGGEPVREWEALSEHPGIYRLKNATSQQLRAYESAYYDVWEPRAMVRYRKQADLAGLLPYPGSLCKEGRNDLLVHTIDNQPPAELWRSRDGWAFDVQRPNVVLRDLAFENYTGGAEARALTIRANTVIEGCRFFNVTRGISSTGDQVRIRNCELRSVGLGILHTRNEMEVSGTLIESAAGRFSFSELNQHLRDGIRIYYPARGAILRNNITVGFWAGLYIKTASSKPDALPFLIEENTFLDGINAGSGAGSPPPYAGISAQPTAVYRRNLIGPNESGNDAMLRLPGIGATLEGNYFFSFERPQAIAREDTANSHGPVPFADLPGGQLTPTLPALNQPTIIGARREKPVTWSPAIARQLSFLPVEHGSFQWVGGPEVNASRAGAVVRVTLGSGCDRVTLFYRKAGDPAAPWQSLPAHLNQLPVPEVIPTSVPVERPAPGSQSRWLAALVGDELAPDTLYEARLEAGQAGQPVLKSASFSFATRGGPRVWHVAAGAPTQGADGSRERPFPEWQPALERALPGDRVEIAAGVYTEAALLRHGGREGAPITLHGAGFDATLLDSGKEAPTLLLLENAPHVVIEGITFRWFGTFGMEILNSPDVQIRHCRFQNAPIAESGRNGNGIYATKSPRLTLERNLFTALEHGAVVSFSPGLRIVGNTAFQNLYAGLNLRNTLRDAVITHNSLTFTGNDSLSLNEQDEAAFASATIDFNNYATFLRSDALYRPENDFPLPPEYGHVGSKAIIRAEVNEAPGVVTRYYTMGHWQEFSGKDRHSFFADPLYVAPLEGDFRVRPGSPNLLPQGNLIGAEGPLPQTARP